jgi:hypothetical protein
MANGNIPSLANLDFEDIRNELKNYLKNQSQFNDYDFDGAGLSVLLDVLAYNTQMNAMISQVTINESFLESAQIRSNVVSHARLLGYVPRSRVSSSAKVNLVVQGDINSPTTITIPSGFKFKGRINNKEYSFVTISSYNATRSATYSYTFNNVEIFEGVEKTEQYRTDTFSEDQEFTITTNNVDLNTLRVLVYDNDNTSVATVYNRYDGLDSIANTNEVFFIRENKFGNYVVTFGDDYLGKKLDNNLIVELKYVVTNGPEANNIKAFTAGASIGGLSAITVTLVDGVNSAGGLEREGIESIRYNAPTSFATQNRAVTANDYRVLVLNKFTEFSDCSIWGGEDSIPPAYGKVFIAPALPNRGRLTTSQKEAILIYLRNKNIGAILPEVVDCEYTDIRLFVGVNYDTNKTRETVGSLEQKVRDAITNYNDTVLTKFNTVFRQSQFLTTLDSIDTGIINTVVRTELFKPFNPNPTKIEDYKINIPSKIYIDFESTTNITSTPFSIEGIQAIIKDEPHPTNDNYRRLYFANASNRFKINEYSDVGYANITTGEIVLQSIKFDLANEIGIIVKPDSYDIAPKFNQLLSISMSDVTIEMNYDTVSANGSSGLATYSPFTRHE